MRQKTGQGSPFSRAAHALAAVACCASGLLSTALAQTTTTYSNTTTGAVNEIATPCTTAGTLKRSFNVSTSYIVGDVDLSVLITHTYRGDLQIFLNSPSGTRVQLVTNNGGAGGDNFNVTLDDEATTPFTSASTSANHSNSAPPYQFTHSPLNPLSAFDGQNAQGAWTLEVCDFFNQDSGNFVRAELALTSAVNADLSLAMAVSNSAPSFGSNVTYTLTLTNSGPVAASGVVVRDLLPSGLSYVSDNGGGAYNSANGLWTIPGSIASGATRTLQITAQVQGSGSYTNLAEVFASGSPDPDSTPNNSSSAPGEDDTAARTITPGGTPGVAPTLSCAPSAFQLDWDANAWPSGSLSQSYTVSSTPISLQFTGDTGFFQNVGGANPITGTALTSSVASGQNALVAVLNYPDTSSLVTLDMNIGASGTGVAQLQFTIFDLDIGAGNSFVDNLIVYGYLNGSLVAPILTQGSANTASGFTATGTAESTPPQNDGNLTVTFTSAVDRVVMEYGSGAGAASNPSQQGIAFHDINFCKVTLTPTLVASKTVNVIGGGYAVPGADVQYTITVQNIGTGATDANSLFLVDPLPTDVSFYSGDIDDAGPLTGAFAFTQVGSGVTFTEASDVRFSKGASAPANFAACTDTPVINGYDPTIRFVCLNPKGALTAGSPTPQFSISFRAQIQ